MLPNTPPGILRVDDGRVHGIFWVLRSGAPWGDLPPLVAFHRGGAKNDSLLSFPKFS
jgi:transposase